MANLYHKVPDNMVGDTLYPLNKLKEVHPEVYKKERKKYEGRKEVMEQTIPYLDCRWNDVLHLTAVHPSQIKNALNTDKTFKYYVIEPEKIEPDKSIIYLYNQKEPLSADDFTSYNPDKIENYTELPEETKQYYNKMQEKGKRPLLFVNVPHILYQGKIEISELEIVEV